MHQTRLSRHYQSTHLNHAFGGALTALSKSTPLRASQPGWRYPCTVQPMRTCTECGTTKPLTEFTPASGGTSYHKRTCQPCRAAAGTATYRPRAKRQPPTERTCTECGLTKPIERFVHIAATMYGFHGRCRTCRNRRARERYYSSSEIHAAEVGRASRNQQARKQRQHGQT
jgi:hypothetical protein